MKTLPLKRDDKMSEKKPEKKPKEKNDKCYYCKHEITLKKLKENEVCWLHKNHQRRVTPEGNYYYCNDLKSRESTSPCMCNKPTPKEKLKSQHDENEPVPEGYYPITCSCDICNRGRRISAERARIETSERLREVRGETVG